MNEKDNLSITINIANIRGAVVRNIQGKNQAMPCVVIPIDKDTMFVGEKGVYIDLVAFPIKEEYIRGESDNRTHSIKQSFSREYRDKLSDAERKELPYIGNVSVLKRQSITDKVAEQTPLTIMNDSDDELSF